MWEIAALSFLAGGIAVWKGLGHVRLRRWHDAAVACGLQVVEISGPLVRRMKLTAQKGSLTVQIEVRHGKDEAIWVVVTGPVGFYGVRICREQNRPRGLREIEIGDDRFDKEFWVEGPPQLVGVLNADTRRLLLRVSSGRRLEIADGELRVGIFDHDLPDLLPHLLEIAQRFTPRADVVPLLAKSARRDPEAMVRLQNLLLLLHEFPKDPRTMEALRTACSDANVQVRLRAALELGPQGHKALMKIAESTEDDACSAKAVTTLGRELGFKRLRAILMPALGKRRIRTAVACLEALGHGGEAAAVPVLAKILARERNELAATAARALGWMGSPEAETPLILALERDDLEVQMSATSALAGVGSAAAVAPLKDAARSSRNDELRRLARQAVAEIQSRLPGASPGQLSLAEAEAGQLSLAQAEAGQLSLATDSAGQLSLGPDEDLS
jgi:HEAT repeat protein